MKSVNKERMRLSVMKRYNEIQPFVMRLAKDNGFYASFVYNMRFNNSDVHNRLLNSVFDYTFDYLNDNDKYFFRIENFNTDGLKLFLIEDVLRDEKLMTFALLMKLMEYTNLNIELYKEVMKCIYEKMFSGVFTKIKYHYKDRVALKKFRD